MGDLGAASGRSPDRGTRELRESLGVLPADQRRALLLAALFGYTAREIGEIEQIPLGTAKTRIRTATQKLAPPSAPTDGPPTGSEERGADCERLREIGPELALGIADGEDRAWALEHLADCPECRARIERLSTLADELLLLAPAAEPPAGFEARVAEAIAAPTRTAALALAAPPARCRSALRSPPPSAPRARSGSRSRDDRELADSYRDDARGRQRRVLRRGADGAPGRAEGRLRLRLPGPGLVGARGHLRRGRRRPTTSSSWSPRDGGGCRCARSSVVDGHGSAGGVTPVAYDQLAEVRLLDHGGREVAESDLHELADARMAGDRPGSG